MARPQQLLFPLDPPDLAPPEAPVRFPLQVQEQVLQATASLLLQVLDAGAARAGAQRSEEVAGEH